MRRMPHRQRCRTPDTCNRPRSEQNSLARCWRIDAKAASKSWVAWRWDYEQLLSDRLRGVLQVAQFLPCVMATARRQAGKQDMTLHLTKMKQKIGRVSEVLGWIVVLLLVLGPWIAWFIGEPYRRHVVREGELCSPSHRWTYAQPKFADSDLSCEPE
jgi:hypothetical protein